MRAQLALQGAKECMTGALDRVRLLRTALQQASLAATIPDAGIIITPALGRTLQRSQEVLLSHPQAILPASCRLQAVCARQSRVS